MFSVKELCMFSFKGDLIYVLDLLEWIVDVAVYDGGVVLYFGSGNDFDCLVVVLVNVLVFDLMLIFLMCYNIE